jgi:hypothetical protein
MADHTEETFLEAKARQAKGQRGKSSETVVEDVLKALRDSRPHFIFQRNQDARAAGRPMPAAVSDFIVVCHGQASTLEVKEVKSGTRLRKFDQLPRQQRWEMAGVQGLVLVHFVENDRWALAWTKDLEPAASWQMAERNGVAWYKSAKEALTFLWGTEK